mmetsp:Transcript_57215/g.135936  ORF Transcript_57215/g.135936 Transcript_57215/m.135936 type:complete len:371 (+) Transcript_57215:8-1120(+)
MRWTALLCGAAALLATAPETCAFAPLYRPLGLRCPRPSLALSSTPSPDQAPDAKLGATQPSKLTSWVETGVKAGGEAVEPGASAGGAASGKEWNGKPRKTESKPVSAKRLEKMERDDPEYQAILARQKEMTAAMRLLQQWDDEQTEFVLERADPSAPLGEWAGLRRVPQAEERKELRDSIGKLCSEASYVLIGMNCESISEARSGLDQWVAGLSLPKPAEVPYFDDTFGTEWATVEEMDADTAAAFRGPVHVAYNSEAGPTPEKPEDPESPPAAHVMVYPAADRGVVFTPILEGFFTQYGDLPLDLFDFANDATPRGAEAASNTDSGKSREASVAARQHAMLGNPQAAEQVMRADAADTDRASVGGDCEG